MGSVDTTHTRGVVVHAGGCIDGVELQVGAETKLYGARNGDQHVDFILQPGEHLTSVRVHHSDQFRGAWIEFGTDQGRTSKVRGGQFPDTWESDQGRIQELVCPSGMGITGLVWEPADCAARDAILVDIRTHPIVRTELQLTSQAPQDPFQRFCWDRVRWVLSGANSGDRRVDCVQEIEEPRDTKNTVFGLDGQTRPTLGKLGESPESLKRVVEVGLSPPDGWSPAEFKDGYHGTVGSNFGRWRTTGFSFRPSEGDSAASGTGVYVVPSFQVAAMYGRKKWGPEHTDRFAVTPDGQRVVIVVKVAVRHDSFTKTRATAYFDHVESGFPWVESQFEWLVPPADCLVTSIIFCLLGDDEPARDIHALLSNHVFRNDPQHVSELERAVFDEAGQRFRGWDTEPCVKGPGFKAESLQVLRDADGTLLSCKFCHHDCNPQNGRLVSRYRKDSKHLLILPNVHIPSISSSQFWTSLSEQKLRVLLAEMRDEGLRCAREEVEQTDGHDAAQRLELAMPTMGDDGTYVYDDIPGMSAWKVLLLFHTVVSHEHLHMHVYIVRSDGAAEWMEDEARRRQWVLGPGTDSQFTELGLPGSYSVTWFEVYRRTWNRPACLNPTCRCTSWLKRWHRTDTCVPVPYLRHSSADFKEPPQDQEESQGYCCVDCRRADSDRPHPCLEARHV